LSVGGHITGLAAIPYYQLYEVPAKSFWTDYSELTGYKAVVW